MLIGVEGPYCLNSILHRLQPADRQEPGDPASAGEELGRARGGLADGDVGSLAI
jgi:hypothetical protein